MLIDNPEVFLKWENGKLTRIGTIKMTVDKDGMMRAKVRHVRQRLGDVMELLKAQEREYQAAVEEREYCEHYEPTYNPEDGSM